MFDPYVIPGTDVLKNHLGITDKELLDKAEADITYLKLLDIDAWFENRPLNYETLLAIHGYIFGDLYPWAGQLRTIDIFKEEEVLGGVYLRYGDTSSLTDQIVAVLDKLNQVSWSEISLEETIPLFSDLIAKLWLIHPFREGNTRTIIRFAGLFANAKGFPLNSKFLRDHANYVRKSLVLYCVEEAPEKVIS
ncbi:MULTISPECIES: Fic/DOC family protein [Enterococcus]|uniref:Fic/DOC family protein n=1 Tax=Enterococcus TaxID=1350 RepID=UPI00115BD774|nr:Fic family protein [Enterococcus faecium]MBD9831632.1 Fic family protein [Enterococcus faecium]MBD9902241.1 Fic family protein [Enterococcus faecium]MBW4157611.1 Fic family protein [Enterococcus faecium]MCA6712801.1 Fic family protein [Enterococcus faecium]MCA6739339.1 Fic family protein [Enterococcus faecium]